MVSLSTPMSEAKAARQQFRPGDEPCTGWPSLSAPCASMASIVAHVETDALGGFRQRLARRALVLDLVVQDLHGLLGAIARDFASSVGCETSAKGLTTPA